MRPAAAVAGGRPGDPPVAATGGASQGAVGPIRIVNLAGEIITDGQPPSGSGPPGGPPCPRFLQWDPDRKKYRKRKGEVPPPSFRGGGGGGSPGPGDEDDGSTSNSSSATSQITRSAKSDRNALTRKKEATEVRFDTLCEPRDLRRYKRKCKKLFNRSAHSAGPSYKTCG